MLKPFAPARQTGRSRSHPRPDLGDQGDRKEQDAHQGRRTRRSGQDLGRQGEHEGDPEDGLCHQCWVWGCESSSSLSFPSCSGLVDFGFDIANPSHHQARIANSYESIIERHEHRSRRWTRSHGTETYETDDAASIASGHLERVGKGIPARETLVGR
jgi:hypothetical protein